MFCVYNLIMLTIQYPRLNIPFAYCINKLVIYFILTIRCHRLNIPFGSQLYKQDCDIFHISWHFETLMLDDKNIPKANIIKQLQIW